MTKRQVIDDILRLNASAKPAFLAKFSQDDLDAYLQHLRLAQIPRIRLWKTIEVQPGPEQDTPTEPAEPAGEMPVEACPWAENTPADLPESVEQTPEAPAEPATVAAASQAPDGSDQANGLDEAFLF